MKIEYNTTGTCSRHISIVVDDETRTIESVSFLGGCHGNTQGIGALARGMKARDLIARCKGIRCGSKATSCPDQLACALEQALGAE